MVGFFVLRNCVEVCDNIATLRHRRWWPGFTAGLPIGDNITVAGRVAHIVRAQMHINTIYLYLSIQCLHISQLV